MFQILLLFVRKPSSHCCTNPKHTSLSSRCVRTLGLLSTGVQYAVVQVRVPVCYSVQYSSTIIVCAHVKMAVDFS